jgi:NhaP-type Na+/H+ or K+/H+ antiporter
MKWFAIGIVALSVSIGAYVGVQKHDFIFSCLVGLVAGLLIVGLARILVSTIGKSGAK